MHIFLFALTLLLCTSCSQGPIENRSSSQSDTILRVAALEPESLDPRQARSLTAVTPLKMLYDGVMRINEKGEIVPAVASRYEVSQDQKTYTFYLRDTKWSNGDSLTANDFAETWLSLLSPNFPAPNAYQFYVIKGARDYKEGVGSKEDVGIKALNKNTLVVTLERPTPFFLELVSTHFYLPVHVTTRNGEKEYVTNGPFTLKEWQHQHRILFERNPLYWDAQEVKLHQVELVVADDNTALQMFLAGELHWIGSPMASLNDESISILKGKKMYDEAPAAGTVWIRFNTKDPLMGNQNLRRALARSISPEVLLGNGTPAVGILPKIWREHPLQVQNTQEEASKAFRESLTALGYDKNSFPTLSLCYTQRSQRLAQALQQHWKDKLGVDVKLEVCEAAILFERIQQSDFQMSVGSWFADIRDPINFLEVFKYRSNRTNNTGWENPQYIQLLNLSDNESSPVKRQELLESAEEILVQEQPVAPLYHSTYKYAKMDRLKGAYLSELGYLDLKHAYYE